MKPSRLDDQMNSILAVAFIALTVTTAGNVFVGASFGRQSVEPQMVAKAQSQPNTQQAAKKPATVVAAAR
ncbi:hypothetical protein GCM10025771_30150 [Niveibacterium umoris]|uniref:Uncharacterized protein n=1 Tax=Niveibacterium umoris TaxID=1193620 RepID=A0A840BJL2_9RHOO|nr:hypothetical protein [Niveibacterium umoris]MBB4011792.1 hypothetical protein [Niveibacterium umoris]